MSTGTLITVIVALGVTVAALASILVRYLATRPKWRTIHLPGFTFHAAGTIDDAKLSEALLVAIECLSPIWSRDIILTSLTVHPLHVFVMDSESWLNVAGVRVGGEAEHQYLKVGPSLSVLCHEMVHYLQWCVGEHEDVTHSTWDARIWQADEAYRAAIK